MTYYYAFLSCCIGVGAYLVTAGVAYLGSRVRRWHRYLDAHERTVALAHRLVQAQAEVMHAEAALAREVEAAPELERRRFAAWARDMAGGLPPLLLAQLRRFGLAEPPPAVEMVVAPGESIRPGAMVAEVDGMAVAAPRAAEDAWGGDG